jgi:hypothetical protein
MHLLIALRLLFKLVRASLHAALVVSVSVALFLLFMLWSVLQLIDEREAADVAAGDTPAELSHALIDRRTR